MSADIFVCLELDSEQKARVQRAAGDGRVRYQNCENSSGTPSPDFLRSEVVFGNPPPEWLPEADALKWLQLTSTGINEYLELDWALLAKRMTVTNLAGFFAEPVAESCLAGILALLRGIDRLVRLQEKRGWIGEPIRAELRILADTNVVLFGFGSINSRLAELLAPFRCNITRIGRDWTGKTLDEALEDADVVACAAPETPRTRNVFNRHRIGNMPSHAVFANFGRGSLVDEDALVEALCNNRLGGAVIDVTNEEPLSPEDRLWRCPNLVLTQHSGGGSTDEIDRKIEAFTSNLGRYRSGLTLDGVVDFSKGY